MVKREVKFFVRIFPTVDKDMVNFKIETNRKTMHIRTPYDLNKYNPKFLYWEFDTDGIFYNSCQEDVYKEAVEDSVIRALKGEEFIILAYGPSSTGKTYTMNGLNGNYKDRGIGPRILAQLFKLKSELKESAQIKIYLSYLEFYGNEVRNLFKSKPNNISLQREKAPQVKCNCESEALCLIFNGESRKKFEKPEVSCSTTVLTYHLDVTWLSKPYSHVLTKILLVDTAGVESISSKTRSDPCQIKSNMTMCWINYVIHNANRAGNENSKLVFRASQLTQYIGPTLLKGNIRFIVHVKLSSKDLLPTLTAMKFGADVKKLPTPQLVSPKLPEAIIKNLQDENMRLKDEILLHELVAKTEYKPLTMSQEQVDHIERLAEEYLRGKVSFPPMFSQISLHLLLTAIRNIFSKIHLEEKKESSKPDLGYSGIVSPVVSTRSLKRPRQSRLSLSAKFRRSMIMRKSRSASSLKPRGYRSSSIFRTLHRTKSGIKSKESKETLSLPSNVSYIFMEEDDTVKNDLWLEFFTRYPQIDNRLRLYKSKALNALRSKEESAKYAMTTRCRLDDAILNYENEQWRRKATMGEVVGADGHELKSEAEIEALKQVKTLIDELTKAREDAAYKHATYMHLANAYNDINETARIEFQDYITKTYTNRLILPELAPTDRLLRKQVESPLSAQSEEDQEIANKSFFEHLQRAHGKSLVCKKSRPYKNK